MTNDAIKINNSTSNRANKSTSIKYNVVDTNECFAKIPNTHENRTMKKNPKQGQESRPNCIQRGLTTYEIQLQ